MKGLVVLLLASLPVPQVQNPRPQPHFNQPIAAAQKKGGKWYLARTGHAVYCYGPVLKLTGNDGGVQRVATFCRGDKVIVPLKD